MQYNEKQFDFSENFHLHDAQKILSSLEEKTRGHNHLVENLDLKTLPKLSDMYLQNNAYLRNLHSSLSNILLGESKKEGSKIDVIQVMILLYMRVKTYRLIYTCFKVIIIYIIFYVLDKWSQWPLSICKNGISWCLLPGCLHNG